uniref:Zinc finger BED domain-containing protein 1 n=1 Tax=Cacopsylla melanoneura TaxID=428564 RepID=A0A8D8X7K5_9HEMI
MTKVRQPLRRARSKESHVWEYFRKEDDGIYVKCKKCQKNLKRCGNTTNLSEHLKRAHGIHNADNHNPDDPGVPGTSSQLQVTPQSLVRKKDIQSFLVSCRQRDLTSKEREELDLALLKMVCQDFQPLSLVENEGFQQYTIQLQQTILKNEHGILYKPPNRKTLTTNLLNREFVKHSSNLREMLKLVNYVSITSDAWTSDSTKSYLTVTGHFIHNDTLHSYVLATRELSKKHTAENIALKIRDIIDEFGIAAKVVAVVTDNAANMKKCVNDCLNKPHFPCTAHTLNLVVEAAINDSLVLKNTIKKCRKIVAHFKQSCNASEALRQYQERLNLPVLKLKQDIETRWNSVAIMFDRLIKTRRPLTMAMAELPNTPEVLSHDDWAILEDSVELLQVFVQATEQLSGEKYPTLAMVIPIVRGIQCSINMCSPGNEFGSMFKNNLVEHIRARFSEIERNRLSSTASFIDPRFKKLGFGIQTNADVTEQNVLRELGPLNLLSRCELEFGEPVPQIEQPFLPSNTSSNSLWSQFEEKKRMNAMTNNSTANCVIEMRHFLASKVIDRTENPLEYYSKNKNVFPTLHELNMKYACIPATSVPSERVFSKTGQVTNSRRNRLAPDNLDKIIFLNSYYSSNK